MTKRYRYIIFSIVTIVLLLSIGTTIAYLYQEDFSENTRPIGKVEMSQDIFHMDSNNNRTEKEVVVISPNINEPARPKPGVYAVNVSNPSSNRYIETLRVNFDINSNVDTYFRVKITTVTTLTYESNNNDLIEVSNILEYIDYEIFKDQDEILANPSEGIVGQPAIIGDWYFDEQTDYYYYKHIVDKDTPTINFITDVNSYVARSPKYLLQLNIKYEAVQAVLGPQKVWGLTQLPWV